MCFLFIWEQTTNCATCSINWLVFITEMKSVYSAVRTVSLNKAVCASVFKGLKNTDCCVYGQNTDYCVYWLLCLRPEHWLLCLRQNTAVSAARTLSAVSTDCCVYGQNTAVSTARTLTAVSTANLKIHKLCTSPTYYVCFSHVLLRTNSAHFSKQKKGGFTMKADCFTAEMNWIFRINWWNSRSKIRQKHITVAKYETVVPFIHGYFDTTIWLNLRKTLTLTHIIIRT